MSPKTAASRSTRSALSSKGIWVPQRQDLIWIDCNPQAGSEMRDMHLMLVLSPGPFNERTGLVIGLPLTTAAYNATNPFALPVGKVSGAKSHKTRYMLCHQPKSFDWRARTAKPHRLGRLDNEALAQACGMLNQIIQVDV